MIRDRGSRRGDGDEPSPFFDVVFAAQDTLPEAVLFERLSRAGRFCSLRRILDGREHVTVSQPGGALLQPGIDTQGGGRVQSRRLY